MVRLIHNSPLNQQSEHDRIFMLLPWYANESLKGAEKDQVAAHIANCVTCHSELKAQQKIQALCAVPAMRKVATRANFEALRHRINNNSAADIGHSIGAEVPPASAKSTQAQAPQQRHWTLQYLVAASVFAVAIGMAIQLYSDSERRPNTALKEYRTLSNSPQQTTMADKNVLLIVFHEDAPAAAIEQLFAELGLKRLHSDQPSRIIRASLLERETQALDGDAMDATLAKLKTSDLVLFAEPAIQGE